jgi:hypothetical protein
MVKVVKNQLFVLRDGFRAAAADSTTISSVKLRDVALQERFSVGRVLAGVVGFNPSL